MAVALSKSQAEIDQLPLVELAWEILKVKKEPCYFRDLMHEVQELRHMSEEQVMDVIARLYTEVNIDGRFICVGQNLWGLKRWYPVDKVADKSSSSKRFVRRNTGDAFSDDDEDIDVEDDFDDDDLTPDSDGDAEQEDESPPVFSNDDEEDEEEAESVEDSFIVDGEEETSFSEDDETSEIEGEDGFLDEESESGTQASGDSDDDDEDSDDDESL